MGFLASPIDINGAKASMEHWLSEVS